MILLLFIGDYSIEHLGYIRYRVEYLQKLRELYRPEMKPADRQD